MVPNRAKHHKFEDSGNMKPIPRRLAMDWDLATWKILPEYVTGSSFKKCAPTIGENINEDEEISYSELGRPYPEWIRSAKNK